MTNEVPEGPEAGAPKKRKKAANGRSPIYQEADGSWVGQVSFGTGPDGKRIRIRRRGKTQEIVAVKVRELERQRDAGLSGGTNPTVKQWMTTWLRANQTRLKPNTMDQYLYASEQWIVPRLGRYKLTALQPEHVEDLYAYMAGQKARYKDEPVSIGTILAVRRVLRAALTAALKRGIVIRNVASIAIAPTPVESDIDAFSLEDVQKILAASRGLRNSARWPIGMLIGGRQNEVLGVKWTDIDPKTREMTIRRSLYRKAWDHGCIHEMPAFRCETSVKGRLCPQRVRRAESGETKAGGKRVVSLSPEIIAFLGEHRKRQVKERLVAGAKWADEGWVFANEDGTRIDHKRDTEDWKGLLKLAGVRDGRLHDMRHTAATMHLISGVDPRVVMTLLGWSESRQADKYKHVGSRLKEQAAKRVADLIWDQVAGSPDGDPWKT